MPESNALKEWWIKALLGEDLSAHPVLERDVRIEVNGNVVTLLGEVESGDDKEEIEREALAIRQVESVINKLVVVGDAQPGHPQTVIAVFPNEEVARLALQKVNSSKLQWNQEPRVLFDDGESRSVLTKAGEAAQVPPESLERYLQALTQGKRLLVDRVPEAEAFRVISALQGTDAESVHTLPPEPGHLISR